MPLHYRRVTYRYTNSGADVDRVFRRIWDLNRQRAWSNSTRYRPPTDVLESAAGLLVKIELAGVREDEVEITLFEDVLVVAGQRHEEYADGVDCSSNECRFHESGVRYGEFRVEVLLPLAVAADRVTARYDSGFLYVTLPRES